MKLFAHRGVHACAPENSLQAFREALKRDDIYGIEFDVWRCKSGELLIMHDDTVDRMTDGHGRITELTYQELCSFHLPNGEPIPLLSEVLELISQKKVSNIELKGQGSGVEVAELLHQYIQQGWSKDAFLVTSFLIEELSNFSVHAPDISVGILYEKMPVDIEVIIRLQKKMKLVSIGIDKKYLSTANIESFHAIGLELYAWTFKGLEDISLKDPMGLDGAFVDFSNC